MTEKYETIKIKVFRLNPDKDSLGRLEEYSFEKLPGMRILGALKAINDQGHNISYRYGCEEWECGSCAIQANGKPVLACKTEVQDGMVLEPLPDLPINKDLIVDRTVEFEKQKELYLKPTEIRGDKLSYEAQEKMWHSITCMECGICLASCPILHTKGKSYQYAGPEYMVQYFRYNADARYFKNSLEESSKDGIWECTSCNNCVENCPQSIPILKQIIELRGMILEDKPKSVPDTFKTLNMNLFRYHNAYGAPESERADWSKGLDVAVFNGKKKENLLFVGDEQAYNKRDQAVAKALVQIFKKANLDFATLGTDEVCAGDPAFMLGETGLFEELASINIERFNSVKFDRIITISPHDYHIIKEEYPKHGGKYDIAHYTEVLDDLIKSKKITFSKKLGKKIAYHDPCYLGRYEKIYDSPRNILKALPGAEVIELAQTKELTDCCGGGGGGNWIDIPAGERMSERRIQQVIDSGAEILAVACPWCLAMFEDAVKAKGYEEHLQVKQIAEIVSDLL